MDPFTKTCSFVLPLLLLAGINPQSAFAQQGVPSSSSPQPSSVTSTLSSSPPQPTTAPAPTIPNNQLIVPWRDHHAGFAGENGVYFSGGRVDPRQAPFSLGGPTIALNRQRAMWQSSNSTYFISAQNLTASISNLSLPALFGHSCAVDAASQIAYCSGGFDSEANPPYEASSSIFRYNLRTGDVQQADMPFSRGFHTSAIVNGSLYLFGGVDCSYCSNRVGYNFTRTTRFNLVDSTVSALLDINTPSAPSDIIGSCSVPIDGNKVLLIGGARTQPSNSAIPDLVWQFDPSNPTTLFAPLRNITGAGPDPRWGVACAKHPKSNLVYVQGGCDPRGGEPVDGKMYVLDATKMAWTTVGGTAGPGPRCFAAGVILNDFFVVHGGRRGPFGTVNSTTSAAGPSSGSSTSLRAPQSTGTAIPPVAAPQPTTSGSSPTPQAGGQQEQAPDTEDASRDDAWADRFIPGGMSSFSPNQAGAPGLRPGAQSIRKPVRRPHKDQAHRRPHKTSRPNHRPYVPLHRRQAPGPQPGGIPGLNDGAIYVFDMKAQDWTKPTNLITSAANPPTPQQPAPPPSSPDSTSKPGAADPVVASSESSATKTKVAVGALLGAMCVLALAVGTGLVYYRKSKKVRRFASLRTQSRRSGSLRVYRVATSNKNARKGGLEEDSADTVLASAQPGHAATGAPEGRFDSNRNVVIPLLAPIQPTDGSLGRGPWDEHGNIMPGGVDRRPTVPRKQGDVSGADSRDLSTVMQQQFGDLSHIQFDSGGGLSVAAFPVRQESIVRKNKTPDYLLSSTDPHGQPVAASMSAAMSTAMASALTTDPHKYQDPHQQEHPYDERQGSPTSPSTGRHTPAPSTSSGGGYVLDEALRYIVVYPHVPRMIDEVELRPGDEVAVRKLYKDGWCRGTNVTTQQTGCFPLLAVEDSTAYEGQDDVVEFWDGGAGFYNNQQPLTVVNPLDDHRRGSTESDREADYHDAASTTTGGFSVLLGGNSGYGADVAGQDHPPMGEVRRGSGDEYGYGYGFGYGEEKIKNTDAMSTKSKPLSPTSDGQANGHDDDRTRLL